ncbi:MAG: hypothetical protein ACRDNW_03880, partial [Trebonia sp.]
PWPDARRHADCVTVGLRLPTQRSSPRRSAWTARPYSVPRQVAPDFPRDGPTLITDAQCHRVRVARDNGRWFHARATLPAPRHYNQG